MLCPSTSTLSCSSPLLVVRADSSGWGWTTPQTPRRCHACGVSAHNITHACGVVEQVLLQAAGAVGPLLMQQLSGRGSPHALCIQLHPEPCMPGVGSWKIHPLYVGRSLQHSHHVCLLFCLPLTAHRHVCLPNTVLCRAAKRPPSSRRRCSSRQQKAQGVSHAAQHLDCGCGASAL